MSGIERRSCKRTSRWATQSGVVMVEFAMLFGLFLVLVFGIIEIARNHVHI
jgi:Flp pilus assembly protein TadG